LGSRARARPGGPGHRPRQGDLRDGRARAALMARAGPASLAAVSAALAVIASADTKLPAALYAKHLVEKPVVFAGNELVLAVPAGSGIHSLAGLAKPGTTIAVGSATVPVGAYAETVLRRLPPAQRAQIAKNIRDREPDVSGIVGKLSEGAVDAGFLYATDVRAAGGKLEAVDLPAALQPKVAYGVAVLRGTPHASEGQAFVEGLLHGEGQ